MPGLIPHHLKPKSYLLLPDSLPWQGWHGPTGQLQPSSPQMAGVVALFCLGMEDHPSNTLLSSVSALVLVMVSILEVLRLKGSQII